MKRVTSAVNAVPMTTATARSTTLPRSRKSLKPLSHGVAIQRTPAVRARPARGAARHGGGRLTVSVAVVAAAASRAAVAGVDGEQQQPGRRVGRSVGRRRRPRRGPARRRPPPPPCAASGERGQDVDPVAGAHQGGHGEVGQPHRGRHLTRGQQRGQPGPDQPDVGDRLAGADRRRPGPGRPARRAPARAPAGHDVGREPGDGEVLPRRAPCRPAGRRPRPTTGTVGRRARVGRAGCRAQRRGTSATTASSDRRRPPRGVHGGAGTAQARHAAELARRRAAVGPAAAEVVDGAVRCGRRRRRAVVSSAALDPLPAASRRGWRRRCSDEELSFEDDGRRAVGRRALLRRRRAVGRGALRRGRGLAAVGAVEARALEDDADRAVDLAHRGAALRALGHRRVGEGLHQLELVLALGVGAGVLVRGHGGGLPGRSGRSVRRAGTRTRRLPMMRHPATVRPRATDHARQSGCRAPRRDALGSGPGAR